MAEIAEIYLQEYKSIEQVLIAKFGAGSFRLIEDSIQEAFIALLLKPPPTSAINLKAWIITTASNK